MRLKEPTLVHLAALGDPLLSEYLLPLHAGLSQLKVRLRCGVHCCWAADLSFSTKCALGKEPHHRLNKLARKPSRLR